MRPPSSWSSRRAPSATSAPRGSTRTGRPSSRSTAPRRRRGARRTARVSSWPDAARRSGGRCRSRRWMRPSRSSRNSRAARGKARSRRSAARRRRPTSPCSRRSSSRSRPAARRVWGVDMNPSHRRTVVSLIAAAVLAVGTTRPAEGQSMPAGAAVMAWHVTIAPSWFDPSTAPPQITPFGMLYAIHDALVRPLPGQKMGPSLAESWKESPDGLTYEFKLRRGLKFHNGDPVTADDVKFSFDRYQGAGAREFRARVRHCEIVDPLTVRFHLKEPWPDFMTFYGTTATAAGIVLPRKYFEQVGAEAFRQRPIGARPYRLVGQRPGVDVTLEAYPAYWRHAPFVQRLVLKSVPDSTTRLTMLKSGQTDFAMFLDGPDAESVKKDARFTLVDTRHASIFWIEFPEQWDPRSPWNDKRLRQAVNYADRKSVV